MITTVVKFLHENSLQFPFDVIDDENILDILVSSSFKTLKFNYLEWINHNPLVAGESIFKLMHWKLQFCSLRI
jgi:hypothetical protein